MVQNSITEIAAEPGPLVFKVAKSAVKSILPGAAKLALKGAKIASAAGSFLLNRTTLPYGVTHLRLWSCAHACVSQSSAVAHGGGGTLVQNRTSLM